MTKKKVIVLTCTWQRVNITNIFVKSLLSTQDKLKNKIEFTNIIIDSEESNLVVFKDNPKFKYYNQPNLPVSNKWNYGVSLCKDLDFDYILMMGSDDIIDDYVLLKYYEYMVGGFDYIGILDYYVFNSKDNRFYYWGGYTKKSGRFGETLGLGRCLSKNLVKQLDFKLWKEDINKGLDGTMESKINKLSNIKKINFKSNEIGIACDIKSDVNITNINRFINDIVEIPKTSDEYSFIEWLLLDSEYDFDTPIEELPIEELPIEETPVEEIVVEKPVKKDITSEIKLKFDFSNLKGHIPDSVLLQLPLIINKFNCDSIIRLSHLLSQYHYDTNGFNKEVRVYDPNTKFITRRLLNKKVYNHLKILTDNDYLKFGKIVGKNFIDNPSLVESKYSLVASAYIFDIKNLWTICDFGINEMIVGKLTKRIYGDSKSVSDRYELFTKYYNILK